MHPRYLQGASERRTDLLQIHNKKVTESGARQIEVDAFEIVMKNKQDFQLKDKQTI